MADTCPLFDDQAEMAEDKDPGIRIALVGKTGAGKSATGNTILGKQQLFKSKASSSTITMECQKETGLVNGQSVSVVDTPGLFDTCKSEEAVKMEIFRCISFLSPGPHVFLIVIQAGRFTKDQQEAIDLIKKHIFGEKAADYTMALFTHGDDLEADGVFIEKFISENEDLRAFISQCGGGYHIFNNREKDPSQVIELLEKIKKMVKKNGGSCFTNEMLKESERAIREEMETLIRDNPNMTPEDARKQAERNNKFIWQCLKAAGIGGGVGLAGAGVGFGVGIGIDVAIGVSIGLVGGPVGAVVGAVAGAAVGGLVAAAATVAAKKRGQHSSGTIQ